MKLRLVLAAAVLACGFSAAPATAQTATATAAPPAAAVKSANRFNRLMKAGIEENAPPMTDGIHDAANPGTESLQPPKEAFSELPRGNSGNRVDWVKALREKIIEPRADRLDGRAQKQVMDLDIIREVKGSMPDVVYPHKPHTEWLDCAQCHPKLFTPKKGSNPISMAAILMGQYCGVCHGKVAFPVSECSKCHSKPKPAKSGASAGEANTVQVVSAPAAAAAAPAAAAPPKPANAILTREQLMEKGKQVYADNCSGCHGENGEGVPDQFPALQGSKVAKGPLAAHLEIVLKGRADTAMQPWADSLSDDDIAAVVTFERNAWGNGTGDVVQPAAVTSAR